MKDYRIGIDVGGTHTDAVLIDKNRVIAFYKAETRRDDILSSVLEALRGLAASDDIPAGTPVQVSTTLTTNLLVEDRREKVLLCVMAGPGIQPVVPEGTEFYHLTGVMDHRGEEIRCPDVEAFRSIAENAGYEGITSCAVVGKFSHRNPAHETLLAGEAEKYMSHVTLGHLLSGRAGFPRRVTTAVINASVMSVAKGFTDELMRGIVEEIPDAPLMILKADGGTMTPDQAGEMPVETILSGPSASIMGVLALEKIDVDALVIDIGGTTTDIALLAGGEPLTDPRGLEIASWKTHVQGLMSRSIGIGGDSAISLHGTEVQVGPRREGVPVALGGEVPTLMDACNVQRCAAYGDVEASRRSLAELGKEEEVEEFAARSVEVAVKKIVTAAEEMIEEVNRRPLYTVHEMMHDRPLDVQKIYCIGGPAEVLKKPLARAFRSAVEVPRYADVANAIGAAVARPTMSAEAIADTGDGWLRIPALGFEKEIPRRYTLDDAVNDAVDMLYDWCRRQELAVTKKDILVRDASSFAMVKGFYSSGNQYRVSCQVRPDVTGRVS